MRKKVIVTCAVFGVLTAVGYSLIPLRTSANVACGSGAGGALRWEAGGAAQQRQDAANDTAKMQKGLDAMLADPAVANSPMGKELIEDAKDEQLTAQAKASAAELCDTLAVTRIELSAVGILLAGVLAVTFNALAFRVGAWSRSRQADRTHEPPLPDAHCPSCGALLDDPIGCWNCGAFEDGERWRTLTDAPPNQARSLSQSSLALRNRRPRK